MPAATREKQKTRSRLDLLEFDFIDQSRPNFDEVAFKVGARLGKYANGDDGEFRSKVGARRDELKGPIDALVERLRELPDVLHYGKIARMGAEVGAKIEVVKAAATLAQAEVSKATAAGDLEAAERAQRDLHDRQAELERLRSWHDGDIAASKKRAAAAAQKAITMAIDDALKPWLISLRDKTQEAKAHLVEALTPSAIEFVALEHAERAGSRERLLGRFARELGLEL
jgi:hypothetical protein